AVSGSGDIVHTINPRLFPEQITYIANHAEDQVLFFDITFLPLVEKLQPALKSIRHYVLLCDRANMPASTLPLLCYEELLAAESDAFEW
ncbi:long-chain fatty acid--CoA ligase, partial [Acinetobacter baumannii]